MGTIFYIRDIMNFNENFIISDTESHTFDTMRQDDDLCQSGDKLFKPTHSDISKIVREMKRRHEAVFNLGLEVEYQQIDLYEELSDDYKLIGLHFRATILAKNKDNSSSRCLFYSSFLDKTELLEDRLIVESYSGFDIDKAKRFLNFETTYKVSLK